ncbi:hypothetical protein U9M48_022944 [Paspalum notatum var. saurae]|uniref:Uncharacterized protein n=1 Tax=Paspalum notatum var. saurae TaxID=547442 RepID=A0AAQ3TM22_PASNO
MPVRRRRPHHCPPLSPVGSLAHPSSSTCRTAAAPRNHRGEALAGSAREEEQGAKHLEIRPTTALPSLLIEDSPLLIDLAHPTVGLAIYGARPTPVSFSCHPWAPLGFVPCLRRLDAQRPLPIVFQFSRLPIPLTCPGHPCAEAAPLPSASRMPVRRRRPHHCPPLSPVGSLAHPPSSTRRTAAAPRNHRGEALAGSAREEEQGAKHLEIRPTTALPSLLIEISSIKFLI